MCAKAIIIGAGMGGLTTAIALQSYGIESTIYESAPEIKPVGAGIWMAPNAMQVFNRLGLAEKVKAGGVPLTNIQVVDRDMKPMLRTRQDEILKTFGFTTTAIKRSVLQEILLAEAGVSRVHLNKTCVSVEEKKDCVCVTFSDGTKDSADYVIAADGIHSVIRGQLFPHWKLRTSEHACWRGMAELQLKPQYKKAIIESWADGLRFGFSEVADGVVDWFAVQKDDASIPQNEGLKESLIHTFSRFAYPVNAILEATVKTGIIKNSLSDLVPQKHWHKGRVCLLGDAAHASTPYMGQGGCQAVEDAYVIAQCLHKEKDVEKAFKEFQKIRMAKAISVVNTSRMMGKIGYLKNMAGAVRNAAMRMTPMSITQKQFCKVYELNF